MAATKIVLALVLTLLVYGAVGRKQSRPESQKKDAQQCQLQKLTSQQPNRQMQSEGGVIEWWDENDEQFQCAGVAAMRVRMQPNSLCLPKFHPYPRLVYVEQGKGVIGITFPGCPETYHSSQQGQSQRDQHQRVHRFRRGDIIAIPPGAANWCYNDGDEEVIAVSVLDLHNQENQLDLNFRTFYLAGGQPRSQEQGSQQSEEYFQNLLSGFDTELLAEAFNVPNDIMKKMQEDNRGPIVNVQGDMTMVRPDEEEEEQEYEKQTQHNRLEENFCSMKIKQKIDTRQEADVVVRKAGRFNIVDEHKLPILRFLDMSSEKGRLFPNAMYAPHWSMTDHRVVYVTRGEARVQIVDNYGDTIMDENVNEGNMFVIPQFYASMAKAGNNGFEWVSFKTSSQPMKSPLTGHTSVMRAMPLEVITNAYQEMSPREAQDVKWNREEQTMILSPSRRSS